MTFGPGYRGIVIVAFYVEDTSLFELRNKYLFSYFILWNIKRTDSNSSFPFTILPIMKKLNIWEVNTRKGSICFFIQ